MSDSAEPASDRILVIDDNPAIHDAVQSILTPPGPARLKSRYSGGLPWDPVSRMDARVFELDSASQGREGVEKVVEALASGRPYALALVDVRMPPGWDGIETIKRMWEADPDVQVAICTAYSDYAWDQVVRELGRSDSLLIVKKPFDRVELNQVVCALTEKWRLMKQVNNRLTDLDRLVNLRTAELLDANERLKKEVTERVRIEEELRRAPKMESLHQIAEDVVHGFNNMLTVIQGQASLLLLDCPPNSDGFESLEAISSAAEQASKQARDLLAANRKTSLRPKPMGLHQTLHHLAGVLRPLLGGSIDLEVSEAPDLPESHTDANIVEQILLNLAANARDAMPDGGRVTLSASALHLEHPRAGSPGAGKDFIQFVLSDTGPGIPAEDRARIFEPFYTTKPPGRGTGMGLSTALGIAKHRGGWIDVESPPGQGATFKVFLPATFQRPAPVQKLLDVTGQGETILLVEDEMAVQRVLAGFLKRSGYKVLCADDAAKALALWELHRDDIQMLISDMFMPGTLSGCDLAQRLKTVKPGLRVILISGYNPEVSGGDARMPEDFHFLAKPFTPQSLSELIGGLFAKTS